jgi:hypothetical protein
MGIDVQTTACPYKMEYQCLAHILQTSENIECDDSGVSEFLITGVFPQT